MRQRSSAVYWAAVLGAALGTACAGAPAAGPRLQTRAAHLSLGERLSAVRRVYPEAASCPARRELGGRVRRVHLSRACAKSLPKHVEDLWLGFEKGRLAEIEMTYDAAYTRQKPVNALTDDLVTLYGPPRRSHGRYWWSDGRTVLRVFYAEAPGGRSGVVLRTSVQLVRADLFRR